MGGNLVVIKITMEFVSESGVKPTITFDEMTAPVSGATYAYSTSTGDKGAATITAVE